MSVIAKFVKIMVSITKLNRFGRALSIGYLIVALLFVLLGIFVDRYWLLAIMFLSVPTVISGGWLFWFEFLLPKGVFSPDGVIFVNIGIHIVLNVLILYFVGYFFSWVLRRQP
jgi:hypothetical protein